MRAPGFIRANRETYFFADDSSRAPGFVRVVRKNAGCLDGDGMNPVLRCFDYQEGLNWLGTYLVGRVPAFGELTACAVMAAASGNVSGDRAPVRGWSRLGQLRLSIRSWLGGFSHRSRPSSWSGPGGSVPALRGRDGNCLARTQIQSLEVPGPLDGVPGHAGWRPPRVALSLTRFFVRATLTRLTGFVFEHETFCYPAWAHSR